MTGKPPPKRVTIADVAREAGVSRTTVSHSLNGLGQVDPRTRERVRETAARLNYRPSVRAQRLRSGRSQALALLSSMPAAVSGGPSQLGFFTELAMGCARTALLRGYVFVLAPPDAEGNPVAQLDIDGAIVLEPQPEDPIEKELAARGIPCVTIGGSMGALNIDLHHAETASLILGHLRERGSRHPALIMGTSGRAAQTAALAQYRELAGRTGFEPVVVEVPESEGESGGHLAAARILAEHPGVDSLFVPIDAFATGAARAGAEAGLTIGSELLVATRYDGLRAQTSVPPLTAVDLHLGEVSSQAVDLILKVLGDAQEQSTSTAAQLPSLVRRASTAGREVLLQDQMR